MNTHVPDQINRVYFIGIAGIGMSAIARYFKRTGVEVAGYDADKSALAKSLEQEGIMVHYTEDESILDQVPDLVIYTPAVQESHKGLQHYRKLGVPVLKRSQILGWISNRHRCIAVAGTHGKTTTSALITYVLRACGEDVTAFLGGLVADLGGNYVHGDSEWLIAEADEYDRSFLALSPEIAVVTAMDADHLDIYGNYTEMVAGYVGFLRNVREGGVVILHENVKHKLSEHVLNAFEQKQINVISFGTMNADYLLTELSREGNGVKFNLKVEGQGFIPAPAEKEGEGFIPAPGKEMTRSVTVNMPGLHNALNATVAMIITDQLKLNADAAIQALKKFSGIKRRFEVVYSDPRLTIIDDYAHHPEELSAAISAARLQYPDRKITGVFQPHLYSRTHDFYREFAASLDAVDESILVELYPARELPIEGVSSKLIFDQITNEKKYLTTKKELIHLLKSLDPEVLLLLGAGDLDRMIPEMIEMLK